MLYTFPGFIAQLLLAHRVENTSPAQFEKHTMADQIRVFHVEDYKIMRDGVRYLLEQDPDIRILGEAKDGQELIAGLKSVYVDVIVLDIYLDAMEDVHAKNGIQLCHYLREAYPTLKVVIHSTYDDADRVSSALAAGAKGFVSKRSGFEELANAVHAVYEGKRYICTETTKRMRNLNHFLLGIEDHLRDKTELFTHREREVLTLLAQGRSSKEIAEDLFITERTVESHRKNMVEKSGVKNTAELIAHAAGLGMIKK
jgi:DNA-binding NarL/FixJ family response regulator